MMDDAPQIGPYTAMVNMHNAYGALALIKCCLGMSLSGDTRASGAEIARKMGSSVDDVGKALRSLDIPTRWIHGSKRYVLDADYLRSLLKQHEAAFKANEKALKSILSLYADYPERIKALRTQLLERNKLPALERELKERLEYYLRIERALPGLMREVESRQAVVDKWNEAKERQVRLQEMVNRMSGFSRVD